MANPRWRNVCFTLNNYTEDDIESIKKITCRYIVFGKEVGESGTPHLQGYIEFNKAINFTTIKKYIPRAHFEQRKGTAKEASDYCKKDKDFFEEGEISKQGARNDLKDIIMNHSVIIKESLSNHTINSYQQLKYAEALLKYSNVKRDHNVPITVIWIHGESGTGKTFMAMKECKDPYIWRASQGKWFDGYDGQKELILDDLRPNDLNWTTLLAILDRYPCKIEYKGGVREMLATTVYVTTLYSLKEFHEKVNTRHNEPVFQLERRVTRQVHKLSTEVEGNTNASTI